jgi:HrpA-like RNA helicase
MKHTEGKWKALKSGGLWKRTIISEDECRNDTVALCQERNAQLIASAPELLEALDRLTIYAEAIMERVKYYNMSELTTVYAAAMPELNEAIIASKAVLKEVGK